jgi:exodeoxyribonuclease V alpha subunit
MNTLSLQSEFFASFFPKGEIQKLAALLYENLKQGSICIPQDELPADEVSSGFLATEKDEVKPFILYNQKFYIQRYFRFETQILEKIKNLVQLQEGELKSRADFLKESAVFQNILSSRDPNQSVDWQLIAAIISFLQNFSIITGGPGTGKTTTVAKVLSLLLSQNENLKVKLAAPTGKAAMRMEESLKSNPAIPENLKELVSTLKASTIHRLLGTINLEPNFKHHSGNLLDADVVIIDEASMIDVALFAKLLDAIAPTTRLILLGDQNQLASVEAGSLFGDLCSSVLAQNSFSNNSINLLNSLTDQVFEQFMPVSDAPALLQDHLVSLQFSYRFQDDQLIGRLSKAVITQDIDRVEAVLEESKDSTELNFDASYDDEVFKEFVNGYQAYIREEDLKIALEKLNSLRVLAAVRMGKQGVYELNKKIESYLFSQKLIQPNSEFYQNRPVIVTKNYYDLKLFNGDVGIVRDGKVVFPDESLGVRHISPGLIAEVETVFAMTIHKSQGSEFDKVMMVLPKSEEVAILTRELLYTGITRSKNKLLIQSSKEVFQAGLSREVRRSSGVKERLSQPNQI